MRLVVAVGLPGSGKSTGLPATALSSDRIRLSLLGDETDQTQNGRVFAALRALVAESLQVNPVTYIDATNLTRRERRQWILLAREYGAEVDALYFDVSLAFCRARNAARVRKVPERVLDLMAARFVPPTVQEGFSRVAIAEPRPEKSLPA